MTNRLQQLADKANGHLPATPEQDEPTVAVEPEWLGQKWDHGQVICADQTGINAACLDLGNKGWQLASIVGASMNSPPTINNSGIIQAGPQIPCLLAVFKRPRL